MTNALDRNQLRDYVNGFWYRPCSDGQVWLSNQPVDINQKRLTVVNGEVDWAAVFLRDDVTGSGGGDALHFVRPVYAGSKFKESEVPEEHRRLVQSWAGLNDCAHFVSEALKVGGINAYSLNVQSLVEQLRARVETKTLAYFVTIDEVARIAKSGILRTGDIFAYGQSDRSFATHGHSTIFMENAVSDRDAKVACHTRLDHPSLEGDWRPYAHPNTLHPSITVIHFGHDDPDPQLTSWLLGWWSVTWRAQIYFYYFDNRGRVGYTQTQLGKGYWFDGGSAISITWTNTGTLEVFSYALPSIPGVSLAGQWNASEPLLAIKLL